MQNSCGCLSDGYSIVSVWKLFLCGRLTRAEHKKRNLMDTSDICVGLLAQVLTELREASLVTADLGEDKHLPGQDWSQGDRESKSHKD